MAAIADTIDFFGVMFCRQSQLSSGAHPTFQPIVGTIYMVFVLIWFFVVEMVEADFSMILTVGASLQFLGFLVLCVRVRLHQSVDGLSSRSLTLFAVHFLLKLSTTSMKNGYIPADETGDFMYQLMDFGSLCCCANLLYLVHKKFASTYEAEQDLQRVQPLIVVPVLLGFIVHGNFNKNKLFDSMWSASLNVETVALLPQLALMAAAGACKVDRSTFHFLACLIGSAICRFEFWWYASSEITSPIAAAHVVLAHCLQLLFIGALLFFYARSWLNGPSPSLAEPVEPARGKPLGKRVLAREMPECSWR